MLRFVTILCIWTTMMLMTSCEEDYIIQREDYKQKIVVNCVFKPGEKWIVNLSTSRDFLSKNSEIKPIENARVSVIEKFSGIETRLDHTTNGNYTYPYNPPSPDRIYELIVEADGFETVRATSKAPLKANVVNIISDVVDKEVTQVNFQVTGSANNYLIWNFISAGPKNPLDTTFNGNANNFVTGIVKYNNISNYLSNLSQSENNAITQEGSFTRNVRLPDENTNNQDTTVTTEIRKYLRIMTASQDLYNYFVTIEKFVAADNHNSSFSYSPAIYSNIQNGLGIFAGYTEEYKEIK